MNSFTPISWRVSRPSRSAGLFPFALDREMNRFFDNFLGTTDAAKNGGSTPGFHVAMDVHEEKDQYVVTAEVPGIPEADIDISLADGILTVKGEKKEVSEKSEGKTHYVSRRFGSFARQIYLESPVDEEKIDAAVKDGVLTIKLPKAPEAVEKVKKISVRSER